MAGINMSIVARMRAVAAARGTVKSGSRLVTSNKDSGEKGSLQLGGFVLDTTYTGIRAAAVESGTTMNTSIIVGTDRKLTDKDVSFRGEDAGAAVDAFFGVETPTTVEPPVNVEPTATENRANAAPVKPEKNGKTNAK